MISCITPTGKSEVWLIYMYFIYLVSHLSCLSTCRPHAIQGYRQARTPGKTVHGRHEDDVLLGFMVILFSVSSVG